MKRLFLLSSVLFLMFSCKRPPVFSQQAFIEAALQHQLLDEKELGYVELNLETIAKPNLRTVASLAKKADFKEVSFQNKLDSVNIDSSFSMIKFFREQLSSRSSDTNKPAIILKDNQTIKNNAAGFLKEIFEQNMITASQYAKLQEQLKQEPVVFPFVVYEWLETMP
jgi:hypothetical protein